MCFFKVIGISMVFLMTVLYKGVTQNLECISDEKVVTYNILSSYWLGKECKENEDDQAATNRYFRNITDYIINLSEEHKSSICKEVIQVCAICEVNPIETNARIHVEVIEALEGVQGNVKFPVKLYTANGVECTKLINRFLKSIPALKCEVRVTNVHRNDFDASISNANPDNSDAGLPVASTNEAIAHFLVFLLKELQPYPKSIFYLDNSGKYYPVYEVHPKVYTE